jgi:hypothetical protein
MANEDKATILGEYASMGNCHPLVNN